jgi:hypothetical protein
LPAFRAHRVALPGKIFFFRQQLLAGLSPLFPRDYFGIIDGSFARSFFAHDSFSFVSVHSLRLTPAIFFTRFLTRNLCTNTAATPPVEPAPATIIAKAAKHAGHMRFS